MLIFMNSFPFLLSILSSFTPLYYFSLLSLCISDTPALLGVKSFKKNIKYVKS